MGPIATQCLVHLPNTKWALPIVIKVVYQSFERTVHLMVQRFNGSTYSRKREKKSQDVSVSGISGIQVLPRLLALSSVPPISAVSHAWRPSASWLRKRSESDGLSAAPRRRSQPPHSRNAKSQSPSLESPASLLWCQPNLPRSDFGRLFILTEYQWVCNNGHWKCIN